MSHKVKLKVKMKASGVRAACKRLKLREPAWGKHSLYGGQHATGLAVKLPGWKYPIVIDEESGEISYDNYGGSWGRNEELEKFKQAYSVAVARKAALKNPRSYVTEKVLSNGTIQLTVMQR